MESGNHLHLFNVPVFIYGWFLVSYPTIPESTYLTVKTDEQKAWQNLVHIHLHVTSQHPFGVIKALGDVILQQQKYFLACKV